MYEEIMFDARLDLVPESPGVYLMKDASGSIIYVGKAVKLRSRLRNYFTPNPKGSLKVLAMISNIANFSFILCANETEALLLECNLIKQFRPKYNILLTDDKAYPYIKITLNEEYPRVVKAFRIGNDVKEGAKYYGPYMNGALRNALKTLKEFFPVRSCNLKLPEQMYRNRPCLNYHIGKCPAPCNNYISQEDYLTNIDGIKKFLEGRYDWIIKKTEDIMKSASENLDFEKAAIYRDKLNSLKQLMIKQSVDINSTVDIDVIGFAHGEMENCVQKLEIRNGRLIGSATFFSTSEEIQDAHDLQSILLLHYTETAFIPTKLFVPDEIGDYSSFEKAIQKLRDGKVEIRIPQRGTGRKLALMAEKNASQALRRRTLISGGGSYAAKVALEKLSEIIFEDPNIIKRVEAFDISNFGDEDTAASMVVFEEGKQNPSAYRLFKIKNQEMQDDYAAMRQALTRRFERIEDSQFGEKPQLVLVDGGVGHVRVAAKVLNELNIKDIALLGMVKDDKHRTKGLAFENGNIIILSEETEDSQQLENEERKGLLRLISSVQNEAHRFAGKYSSKLSLKRQTKFSLESIKGVGVSRRKSLLEYFGSLRAIKSASIEELSNVKGINKDIAKNIYLHFNEESEGLKK